MRWRPWRLREASAAADAQKAAEDARQAAVDAQEAADQVARVKAQWPLVKKVNAGLRHETVVINGWTARAKDSMR